MSESEDYQAVWEHQQEIDARAAAHGVAPHALCCGQCKATARAEGERAGREAALKDARNRIAALSISWWPEDVRPYREEVLAIIRSLLAELEPEPALVRADGAER